jgi:tetratricopeptide (TPR) repeat protein
MGIVYKVLQIEANRIVALKFMIDFGLSSVAERARFKTEAEAQARLQHPNIVPVYEVGEYEGMPYFTMEYCAGGNLHDRLAGTPVPPGEAARFIEVLARAAHAAHEAKVVHRDLKPLNVLLVDDPRVPLSRCTPKLGDFGLARKLDSEGGYTRPGQPMGSPPYMPPEQVLGNLKLIGPATDVYALGAILYELLTGRPPFLGPNTMETYGRVLADDAVPVRQLQPRTPRDLDTICLKCLQKDPQKRYSSAEALAEDLRRFSSGEPIQARPAGWAERAVKWCRRRPTAAALIAVLFSVAISASIAISWHLGQLRKAVEDTTAELEVMHQREQEARQREQRQADLIQVRAAADKLLGQGRDELEKGSLDKAQAHFTDACKRITDAGIEAPELGELHARAMHFLDDIEKRRADLKERATVRANFAALPRYRDEAMSLLYRGAFTGTYVSGLDEAAAKGIEGLRLFSLPERPLPEKDLPGLTKEKQQELRVGLYEVCLLIAEATARPRPKQTAAQRQAATREGLRWLERAAEVCPTLKLCRRQRYLAWMGEKGDPPPNAVPAPQPSNAIDWFFDGCDKMLEHDHDPAIASFDHAARLSPGLFWAHLFRAVMHAEKGNWAEARAGLTLCVYLRPRFVWAYLLRGFVCGQAKDFAAARADFQEAEKYLTSADDPLLARYVLLVNRGVVALEDRDVAGAIKDIQAAIDLRPEAHAAYFDLGVVYNRSGDPARARDHLNRALKHRPDLAEAHHLLATMDIEEKKYGPALEHLQTALERGKPGNARELAKLYRDCAFVLEKLQRFPEALVACQRSLKQSDDDPQAHYLHGVILLDLNEWRAALTALDKVPVSHHTENYYHSRARAYANLNQTQQAILEYTHAVQVQPSASTYTKLGWAHLGIGALEQALVDFRTALLMDDHNAEAHVGCGVAHLKRKDRLQALEAAETALKHDKKRPLVLAQAARIFIATRRSNFLDEKAAHEKRALELLAEALRNTPPTEQEDFFHKVNALDLDLKALLRDRGLASVDNLLRYSPGK